MKKFNSLQDGFLNYCRHITDAPLVNSRGSTQRELLFESFEITDPTAIDIKVEDRKFSTGYALTEWLWYLSCDRNTNNIGKMAKIWNQISDDKGEVESNYGTYIAPQWSWILGELTDDRDSRRATIVINQVHHKFSNEKDYAGIRNELLHNPAYLMSKSASPLKGYLGKEKHYYSKADALIKTIKDLSLIHI